ncbi:ATP-grasp domain-containing protein [Galactobacter sp.]|uniref:carboxylate--amine ligase n=1 Tax=Galactobacter sp. TaxID=2676125 RepID=UPI0025C543BA|nr:ATP-grasp domain-containing protein [Galactobacter sp.]
MASNDLLPVVIGFDIADYSFARIFHEAAGLRSLVISEVHRGPIENSSIFDVQIVPKGTLAHEDKFVDLLHRIAEDHPEQQLLLLVNSDEGVEFAARNRAALEPRWFLPYAPIEAVERANSKEDFYEVCTSLGLDVPARSTVDLRTPQAWADNLSTLTFPVVVKPAVGSDLDFYWGQGLRKVKVFDSAEDANTYFSSLRESGVDIELMVQELIPGDDTTQWVINGYVDAQGRVTATGTGRVLLGLHQPRYLGNAGMILLEPNPELARHAQRLVTAVGLRGFFSLDVKMDPRDGRALWLDLNPRIGRSHYYLKVGGIDLAKAMLADLAGEESPYQTNARDGIYTVLPMALANKTYLQDPQLRQRVRRARKAQRPVNPLKNPADRHPKRFTYRLMNSVNQWRQMRRFYPRPTESGF